MPSVTAQCVQYVPLKIICQDCSQLLYVCVCVCACVFFFFVLFFSHNSFLVVSRLVNFWSSTFCTDKKIEKIFPFPLNLSFQ